MLKRWLTSLIGIPIAVAIWVISPLWNEIPVFMLITIVNLIINYEILTLTNDNKELHYPFFTIGLFSTVAIIFTYLLGMNIITLSVYMIAQFILFLMFFYYIVSRELFQAHDFSRNFEYIGFLIITYITLVLFFPQVFLLQIILPNSWGIILLFGFCWISDAFGLFTGMLIGKHKLTMLPSKSKTIEGYFGSILFTSILGLLCYYLQGLFYLPFQWSMLKWVGFGFTMSLSSNFGDLTESLIKRWASKKDSSNLLPGLGGFFDAIDSQIYSTPIALLFFYL